MTDLFILILIGRERLVVLYFDVYFDGLHCAEWRAPVQSLLTEIQAVFEPDMARAARPTPLDLLAHLKDAQREKVANKTRELERERGGEVESATHLQSRLMFPAHVLARWDPEVRKDRLITRRSGRGEICGASETGAGLQNTSRGRGRRAGTGQARQRSDRRRRYGEALFERTAEDSVVRKRDDRQ